MTAAGVRAVIDAFLEDNCRAMSGERVDVLRHCHDDLTWTMTGNTPVAGTYNGLDDFRANIGAALQEQFSTGDGFGLFLVDIIVEGNRATLVLRGRGDSATGATYNNNYFFLVEIRDDKIFSVIESCDGSLVWRSVFDTHLEAASQPMQ